VGTRVAIRQIAMLHVFRAGPDLVRWELMLVERGRGPYRLALHHPHGVIVEYFQASAPALSRIGQLEALVKRARGFVEDEEAVPA
jgi:hypothetical protein